MSNFLMDMIIPIAKNDVNALRNSLPYIIERIPVNKIHIIANGALKNEFSDFPTVEFIDENLMVENLSFNKVKEMIEKRYPKATRRTGWYFQQFLKLAYARVSETDFYLSWDSDTIPLKNQSFFNEQGQAYLDFLPYVKSDEAYFTVLKRIWPNGVVEKKQDNSYITEHMIFSKSVVLEMIAEIENEKTLVGQDFFERIINAIDIKQLNLSGFSEFETYACYVNIKHPEQYRLRRWHNLRHGKIFVGDKPTQNQLEWIGKDFDVLSIEDFDRQWLICKKLCGKEPFSTDFINIFHALNPFINVQYNVRLKLRKIIKA